ncbi:hypothetical protein GCM10023350_35920 [Nocardioides endophyticus]|uniref:Uncharacterized protein n=1 Tax=Nocardioides endophyticus TaxID=1353775 RepID=A0ABP8Z6C1_9ACTN
MSLKDDTLVALQGTSNVAQFVSFGPGAPPEARHLVLRARQGDGAGLASESVEPLVKLVMDASASNSVNVRSFKPDRLSGNPFHYGLTDIDSAAQTVRQLARDGYYTIVNETIDVSDGGVSGVYQGGVIEFAPGDTPRAVEDAHHLTLPAEVGTRLLEAVYGFDIDFGPTAGRRIEFSVHPMRVGVQHSHVIIWETSRTDSAALSATIDWPNPFSHLIGDKVFGLLVADLFGWPVPSTKVFPRSLPPFSFGRRTGTSETWLRTAPRTRTPGQFTTIRGWVDPFSLLAQEDLTGEAIASVLAQEGVDAHYSGAAAPRTNQLGPAVEGVRGYGDRFMLGEHEPEHLPPVVESLVAETWRSLVKMLGPVSLEWAYDGNDIWVLQLHRAGGVSGDDVIYPGSPAHGWLQYKAGQPLDDLRELITQAQREDRGIEVHGRVGITSHVGDLLRGAGIPARRA